MRRSGSVLQYHIARDAAKELGGIDLGWMRWQDFNQEFNTHDGSVNLAVVKTHVYFPEHSSLARQVISEGRYKVVTIYRDMRDAVASSKRAWKLSMIEDLGAIQHEFNSWASLGNAMITRYEDIVDNVPLEVMRIRTFLGVETGHHEPGELFSRYEKENMRKLQKEDTDERGYSHTHHMWSDHVGSGKVGRWRSELSEQELSRIELAAGGWQRAHGYV